MAAKGIHGFRDGVLENGFRHIVSIERPVRRAEDLAGYRMRIPAGRMFDDFFRSLGAFAGGREHQRALPGARRAPGRRPGESARHHRGQPALRSVPVREPDRPHVVRLQPDCQPRLLAPPAGGRAGRSSTGPWRPTSRASARTPRRRTGPSRRGWRASAAWSSTRPMPAAFAPCWRAASSAAGAGTSASAPGSCCLAHGAGMKPSVLIVGGGIGGLSLARELTLRGLPVTVLEKAPRIVPVGAGIIMNPNAMGVLERNGLADALRANAWPYLARDTCDRHGRLLARRDYRPLYDAGKLAVGALVHRAHLHDVLYGGVPPGAVRLSSSVKQNRPASEGVQRRRKAARPSRPTCWWAPTASIRRCAASCSARRRRATWATARTAWSWTTSPRRELHRAAGARPAHRPGADLARAASTSGPPSTRRASPSRSWPAPTRSARLFAQFTDPRVVRAVRAAALAGGNHHHRGGGAGAGALGAGQGGAARRLGARHDAQHRPGRRHGDGGRGGAGRRTFGNATIWKLPWTTTCGAASPASRPSCASRARSAPTGKCRASIECWLRDRRARRAGRDKARDAGGPGAAAGVPR